MEPDNKLLSNNKKGYKPIVKEQPEPKKEDKKIFTWGDRTNLIFDPEFETKNKKK